MKKLAYLIFLSIVLVSCGPDGKHFKIDGHFLNLNQGEFYIYSLDGGMDGFDTIKVDGGRFAYEMPCEGPSILMLVFPNFSEQPIFAEPGKSVDVTADASHIKEMEVKGTKDNELMNSFRKQIENASPDESKRYADQFILDHPGSRVGGYLVRKYFMLQQRPDYKRANTLIYTMLAKQSKNGFLIRMQQMISGLKDVQGGSRLPSFSATDVDGDMVSNGNLSHGVAVISAWSTGSYDSMDMQRQLNQLRKKSGGRLQIMSVCLDASKVKCRASMKSDSIIWSNVCDEEMFEGSLVKRLGISNLPDNIVIKDGTIVDRGLSTSDLINRLKTMLNL